MGRYKLNIDGSARNGIITSGGVVRDYMGRMVALFSIYYGSGTITEAEFRALLHGLDLCSMVGVNEVNIER